MKKINEYIDFYPGQGMQANSYAIYTGQGYYLVDPNMEAVEDTVRKDLRLLGILATHGHFDHHLGTIQIYENLSEDAKDSLPFYMHEEDHVMAEDTMANASGLFGFPMTYQKPNKNFLDGEKITLNGDFSIEILHTPGHSPGCVCLLLRKGEKKIAFFSGDTIFQTDIGRVDLYKSSPTAMQKSLRKIDAFAREKSFAEDLPLLSGHGPDSYWAEVERENLWLKDAVENA